jgi:hypothetical protein
MSSWAFWPKGGLIDNCGFVVLGLGILLASCAITVDGTRHTFPFLFLPNRERGGTVPPEKTPRLLPDRALRTAEKRFKLQDPTTQAQ